MKYAITQAFKPFILLAVGGAVVFLYFSLANNGEAARRELELLKAQRQTAEQVAKQLRGELPVQITNEQIQWYNAGRASILEDMRKGYRELKKVGKESEFWINLDVDGENLRLEVLKVEEG